jgi:hypothetical protein
VKTETVSFIELLITAATLVILLILAGIGIGHIIQWLRFH